MHADLCYVLLWTWVGAHWAFGRPHQPDSARPQASLWCPAHPEDQTVSLLVVLQKDYPEPLLAPASSRAPGFFNLLSPWSLGPVSCWASQCMCMYVHACVCAQGALQFFCEPEYILAFVCMHARVCAHICMYMPGVCIFTCAHENTCENGHLGMCPFGCA